MDQDVGPSNRSVVNQSLMSADQNLLIVLVILVYFCITMARKENLLVKDV